MNPFVKAIVQEEVKRSGCKKCKRLKRFCLNCMQDKMKLRRFNPPSVANPDSMILFAMKEDLIEINLLNRAKDMPDDYKIILLQKAYDAIMPMIKGIIEMIEAHEEA